VRAKVIDLMDEFGRRILRDLAGNADAVHTFGDGTTACIVCGEHSIDGHLQHDKGCTYARAKRWIEQYDARRKK
jgi:hypothetical protein